MTGWQRVADESITSVRFRRSVSQVVAANQDMDARVNAVSQSKRSRQDETGTFGLNCVSCTRVKQMDHLQINSVSLSGPILVVFFASGQPCLDCRGFPDHRAHPGISRHPRAFPGTSEKLMTDGVAVTPGKPRPRRAQSPSPC